MVNSLQNKNQTDWPPLKHWNIETLDIEIFVDENNNQDETYILDESDLDEESDSNSSQVCLSSEEDDEQLDKN